MIDEVKMSSESNYAADPEEEQSMFNFQNLFAMLVINWQWFLLSLIICVCRRKSIIAAVRARCWRTCRILDL